MTQPTLDLGAAGGLEAGMTVRYWPGIRAGEGCIGTALTGWHVLGGHTTGAYIRKSDGGSDFIAATHIEILGAVDRTAAPSQRSGPEPGEAVESNTAARDGHTSTRLAVTPVAAGRGQTSAVLFGSGEGTARAAEEGPARGPDSTDERGAGPSTRRPPAVVGLDLSLTATGIADSNGARTILGMPLKRDAAHILRWTRMLGIADEVDEATAHARVIAVEGPSFGSNDPGAHERAGLWWMVYGNLARIWALRIVVVAPASLKRYATGKGNAGKPQMVAEAIRRLGYTGHDDNECDALWLRAMALDHYGHPLCPMPAANRAALEKVAWPELAVTP